MDIVATVLVIQDLAVSGHENRDGIREQNHPRGNFTSSTIKVLMSNTDILQLNCIHQVMQRDVCVTSPQPRKQGRHQSAESDDRIATEGTKEQIEPDNIRLQLLNRPQDANHSHRIIERPATHDIEALRFNVIVGKLVGQHREVQKWIPL
jgi:putative lipoic acid-binding regulatory protein